MTDNQIVLTGIKPTGEPHLGNYIGALKPAIEMANHMGGYVFIADLHALNALDDRKQIAQYSQQMAAALIALGLDTDKAVLFRQSDIPEVSQLSCLLMNVTSKGLMNRAHAYKAIVERNTAAGTETDAGVNMGLYTYPILMAADILLYGSNLVPVGQDQKQHVEFARDIAGSFNHIYGEILTLPEPYIRPDTATLPGLDGRKMSKSYNNTIPLFVSEGELKKRLMRIITDSKLPAEPKDPETSTIYQLYKHFAPAEDVARMQAAFKQGGMGYGDAKKILYEAVNAYLTPLRETYHDLLAHPQHVEDVLTSGAQRARARAKVLLDKVGMAMLGHPIAR